MVYFPEGFKFYSGFAGFYSSDRPDVLLIVSEKPATAAGVFTSNRLKAAPVRISQDLLLKNRYFSGVLVNAGFANAATGKKGIEDAEELLRYAAEKFSLPFPILAASTGVIGKRLPVAEIKKALEGASEHRDLELAARSIMTTDTFPKFKSLRGNGGYVIAGISKGAGMIAPSMATTLTFVLTDASLPAGFLKSCLLAAVEKTFNRISVDGEQSTNDCILLLSSNEKEVLKIHKEEFRRLLISLLHDLSIQILKDGEGATKLIKVFAEGFATNADADAAARKIALSPLVRTAIHGSDPNWGRIFSAVGDSGASVREEKLEIYIGKYPVFKGEPVDFPEEELSRYLRSGEVEIRVRANLGRHDSYFYSCDLSEEYIRINSSYTS